MPPPPARLPCPQISSCTPLRPVSCCRLSASAHVWLFPAASCHRGLGAADALSQRDPGAERGMPRRTPAPRSQATTHCVTTTQTRSSKTLDSAPKTQNPKPKTSRLETPGPSPLQWGAIASDSAGRRSELPLDILGAIVPPLIGHRLRHLHRPHPRRRLRARQTSLSVCHHGCKLVGCSVVA